MKPSERRELISHTNAPTLIPAPVSGAGGREPPMPYIDPGDGGSSGGASVPSVSVPSTLNLGEPAIALTGNSAYPWVYASRIAGGGGGGSRHVDAVGDANGAQLTGSSSRSGSGAATGTLLLDRFLSGSEPVAPTFEAGLEPASGGDASDEGGAGGGVSGVGRSADDNDGGDGGDGGEGGDAEGLAVRPGAECANGEFPGEPSLDCASPDGASAEGPSFNGAEAAVERLHPRVGAGDTTVILDAPASSNTPPQSVLPGQRDEVPETTLPLRRDPQPRDPPYESVRQQRPSLVGLAPTEGGEEDRRELPEMNTPQLQPMQAQLIGMYTLDLLEGVDHLLPGDPRVGVDLIEQGVSAATDMEPALSLASGISAVPALVAGEDYPEGSDGEGGGGGGGGGDGGGSAGSDEVLDPGATVALTAAARARQRREGLTRLSFQVSGLVVPPGGRIIGGSGGGDIAAGGGDLGGRFGSFTSSVTSPLSATASVEVDRQSSAGLEPSTPQHDFRFSPIPPLSAAGAAAVRAGGGRFGHERSAAGRMGPRRHSHSHSHSHSHGGTVPAEAVARVWRNADLHGGTPTLDSGDERPCMEHDEILPGHDAAAFADRLRRKQQQVRAVGEVDREVAVGEEAAVGRGGSRRSPRHHSHHPQHHRQHPDEPFERQEEFDFGGGHGQTTGRVGAAVDGVGVSVGVGIGVGAHVGAAGEAIGHSSSEAAVSLPLPYTHTHGGQRPARLPRVPISQHGAQTPMAPSPLPSQPQFQRPQRPSSGTSPPLQRAAAPLHPMMGPSRNPHRSGVSKAPPMGQANQTEEGAPGSADKDGARHRNSPQLRGRVGGVGGGSNNSSPDSKRRPQAGPSGGCGSIKSATVPSAGGSGTAGGGGGGSSGTGIYSKETRQHQNQHVQSSHPSGPDLLVNHGAHAGNGNGGGGGGRPPRNGLNDSGAGIVTGGSTIRHIGGILRTGSVTSATSHGAPSEHYPAAPFHGRPAPHPHTARKSVSFFDDEQYELPTQLRRRRGGSQRTYDDSGGENTDEPRPDEPPLFMPYGIGMYGHGMPYDAMSEDTSDVTDLTDGGSTAGARYSRLRSYLSGMDAQGRRYNSEVTKSWGPPPPPPPPSLHRYGDEYDIRPSSRTTMPAAPFKGAGTTRSGRRANEGLSLPPPPPPPSPSGRASACHPILGSITVPKYDERVSAPTPDVFESCGGAVSAATSAAAGGGSGAGFGVLEPWQEDDIRVQLAKSSTATTTGNAPHRVPRTATADPDISAKTSAIHTGPQSGGPDPGKEGQQAPMYEPPPPPPPPPPLSPLQQSLPARKGLPPALAQRQTVRAAAAPSASPEAVPDLSAQQMIGALEAAIFVGCERDHSRGGRTDDADDDEVVEGYLGGLRRLQVGGGGGASNTIGRCGGSGAARPPGEGKTVRAFPAAAGPEPAGPAAAEAALTAAPAEPTHAIPRNLQTLSTGLTTPPPPPQLHVWSTTPIYGAAAAGVAQPTGAIAASVASNEGSASSDGAVTQPPPGAVQRQVNSADGRRDACYDPKQDMGLWPGPTNDVPHRSEDATAGEMLLHLEPDVTTALKPPMFLLTSDMEPYADAVRHGRPQEGQRGAMEARGSGGGGNVAAVTAAISPADLDLTSSVVLRRISTSNTGRSFSATSDPVSGGGSGGGGGGGGAAAPTSGDLAGDSEPPTPRYQTMLLTPNSPFIDDQPNASLADPGDNHIASSEWAGVGRTSLSLGTQTSIQPEQQPSAEPCLPSTSPSGHGQLSRDVAALNFCQIVAEMGMEHIMAPPPTHKAAAAELLSAAINSSDVGGGSDGVAAAAMALRRSPGFMPTKERTAPQVDSLDGAAAAKTIPPVMAAAAAAVPTVPNTPSPAMTAQMGLMSPTSPIPYERAAVLSALAPFQARASAVHPTAFIPQAVPSGAAAAAAVGLTSRVHGSSEAPQRSRSMSSQPQEAAARTWMSQGEACVVSGLQRLSYSEVASGETLQGGGFGALPVASPPPSTGGADVSLLRPRSGVIFGVDVIGVSGNELPSALASTSASASPGSPQQHQEQRHWHCVDGQCRGSDGTDVATDGFVASEIETELEVPTQAADVCVSDGESDAHGEGEVVGTQSGTVPWVGQKSNWASLWDYVSGGWYKARGSKPCEAVSELCNAGRADAAAEEARLKSPDGPVASPRPRPQPQLQPAIQPAAAEVPPPPPPRRRSPEKRVRETSDRRTALPLGTLTVARISRHKSAAARRWVGYVLNALQVVLIWGVMLPYSFVHLSNLHKDADVARPQFRPDVEGLTRYGTMVRILRDHAINCTAWYCGDVKQVVTLPASLAAARGAAKLLDAARHTRYAAEEISELMAHGSAPLLSVWPPLQGSGVKSGGSAAASGFRIPPLPPPSPSPSPSDDVLLRKLLRSHLQHEQGGAAAREEFRGRVIESYDRLLLLAEALQLRSQRLTAALLHGAAQEGGLAGLMRQSESEILMDFLVADDGSTDPRVSGHRIQQQQGRHQQHHLRRLRDRLRSQTAAADMLATEALATAEDLAAAADIVRQHGSMILTLAELGLLGPTAAAEQKVSDPVRGRGKQGGGGGGGGDRGGLFDITQASVRESDLEEHLTELEDLYEHVRQLQEELTTGAAAAAGWVRALASTAAAIGELETAVVLDHTGSYCTGADASDLSDFSAPSGHTRDDEQDRAPATPRRERLLTTTGGGGTGEVSAQYANHEYADDSLDDVASARRAVTAKAAEDAVKRLLRPGWVWEAGPSELQVMSCGKPAWRRVEGISGIGQGQMHGESGNDGNDDAMAAAAAADAAAAPAVRAAGWMQAWRDVVAALEACARCDAMAL